MGTHFCQVNYESRSFAIQSQISYEKKVGSQLKTKPKLFHAYIKYRKVGKPGIGPLKTDNGCFPDSPSEMAESFATSFASVYSTELPIKASISLPTLKYTSIFTYLN